MSGFADMMAAVRPSAVADQIAAADGAAVRSLLARPSLHPSDAPVLFSAAALPYLEELAARARMVTLSRFGRAINLYAPVYLANHCINRCSYCGFAASRQIPRIRLTCDEAIAQAEILWSEGIRHLLLVTGEAPAAYGMDDICEVVAAIRPRFASVSVEIFACDLPGYQRLVAAGVDGLVLYQEVYDPERYAEVHECGPKRDHAARLAAIEAGGEASFRSLGIGTLLGLAPHRVEACYLAWHADYLNRRFPRSRLALSFPRLRPVKGGTGVEYPVSAADLVQLIVGSRLLFPDAEIVVSTREPATLRDRLLPLGVTRISAGSRTSPGGYGQDTHLDAGQFSTDDQRGVADIIRAVQKAGFDATTKDFDPAFLAIKRASPP